MLLTLTSQITAHPPMNCGKKNKHLFILSHTVCGILLWPHKQTKTQGDQVHQRALLPKQGVPKIVGTPPLPSHLSQGLELSLVRKFLILSFYLIVHLASLPHPAGLSTGAPKWSLSLHGYCPLSPPCRGNSPSSLVLFWTCPKLNDLSWVAVRLLSSRVGQLS